MKKEEFEFQIEKHEKILEQKNRIFRIIGYIKLLHVLFIGWILYLVFFSSPDETLLIISGVITVILIAFWIFHERLKDKIKYSQGIISINRRNLDRLTGAWSGFADTGSEFVNHDHPYASDLDIVGKKSVFQFLNSTNTWHGRQRFAADLLNPNYTDEEITSRQIAIAELSEDVDFANHIEYKFKQIGVHAAAKFIAKRLENSEPFVKSGFLKMLAIYGPLLALFFAGYVLITTTTILFPIVAMLAIFQLFIWVLLFFPVTKYLEDVSQLSYNLAEYGEAVHELQRRNFKSEKLIEIQKCLTTSEVAASVAIKELGHISSRANLRRNVIAWMILNVALLWDLTTAIRFGAWKNKYANYAESWFISLGEFESFLSFSHLPNVCSTTCVPTICVPTVIDNKTIQAKNLGHPLINNEARVSNDVACRNNIFIISGSNMSGKTTFLRSVGVNLILARAGSFVCAKEMNFTQLDIMTSMRIADNLSEGISTFYAELKRIKGIIELARTNSDMLFLIDEIFRGTNSVDRLSGAITILQKLNELGVIGMITTHDLELCEIAKDYPRIRNYSFSESYIDNEIHFNYEMREGVSTTTNAKHLMKMMDII